MVATVPYSSGCLLPMFVRGVVVVLVMAFIPSLGFSTLVPALVPPSVPHNAQE
jgi:hypothetical protein